MTDRLILGALIGPSAVGPSWRWAAADEWWLWREGRFEELSRWLDDRVYRGFELMELGRKPLPSSWTLTVVKDARREQRELDTEEMLWILGHWPGQLRIPERCSPEQGTGWLTVAAATRAGHLTPNQEARRAR